MSQLYDVAEFETPAREFPRESVGIPPARNQALFYGAVIFLSAFLLFQVQLVIGKYILPRFGGGPSVWNTSLFFFRFSCCWDMRYAHWLSSRRQARVQSRLHIALLCTTLGVVSILWLKWGTPITPGATWKPEPGDNPVAKILELLSLTVALPFFLLSTTSPLLQNWFARSHGGKSPYRLYALSNAGSLLGLLSYPFLVEWLLTIKHQALLWSCGFVLFALACTAVAWQFRSDFQANCQDSNAGLVGRRFRCGSRACALRTLDRARHLLLGDASRDDQPAVPEHRRDSIALGRAAQPLPFVIHHHFR